MKVAVVADLQAHAYPAFSRILPSGRNSRLQHGIDALNFAVDQADGGYLVVLGDLFEDRRSLSIDVLDAVTEAIQAASGRLKGIRIIAGNHDQFFRDGSVTSLRHFEGFPNVRVVYDTLSEVVDGVPWHFAAFQQDADRVRQWIKGIPSGGVLCLHQAMLGAEADGGFIYENANSLAVGDVRPHDFSHVLVGHFHKPQSLAENVHYLGSPYQIKMNELGEVKRIAVVEGKPPVLTWVPVTGIPTFRRIRADDFDRLSEEERSLHFWEVEGIPTHVPDNARLKPEPKPAITYSSSCSDFPSAAREWLTAKGHGDRLLQLAQSFLP